MGSNTGYTIPAQIRFMVQWFSEWSEMQRNDFLPILAQNCFPSCYVNGLVSSVDNINLVHDHPISLFQCRVKLFKEWAESWDEEHKEELLNKIKAIDSRFAEKLEQQLVTISTSSKTQSETETTGLQNDVSNIMN